MSDKTDRYDDFTRNSLRKSGMPSSETATRVRRDRELPYNTAGLAALQVREMPYLADTNVGGFVLASNRKGDEDANRRAQQNIFVEPSATHDTIAHEAEHLLARQGLGHPALVREKFQELMGDAKAQRAGTRSFIDGLLSSAPYLKEKYGIDNAYMDPKFIREQGRVGLYELLATLAGTEVAQRVDLTKDPELRKTLFKDKNVREAYSAVTGLRQTRLDARDLPSYTRLPEKEDRPPGMIDRLKQLLKFADGGAVPNAGNRKII